MVAVALARAAAFEHIRVRGGIQRTKRKAKRRPFQLQLTALAINGTKQRTPEPAQEREAPELTALPTEPVYPAEQATRSPKPASTRALLSVQAVCIPGCNGAGRRFRQNRPQQRKKGSGRNTQLRSFSLHALLPAAQPTLSASISAASGPSATGSGQASLGTPVSARLGADQAGAAGAPSSPHSNRAPLDPSAYTQTPGAGLTFNLSATPRPPSAFPSPAPSAAGTPASASLHNITKTPSVSSLRLRGTPMEGVPERPASAAGLRPLCAPTSTVKPGSLVTCQWLSPIEGLHEMRGLGPLSSFSSGRARSTGRRQSLSRFSVGTPMEGVPERSLPPAPTPSVARSLQQGLLWQQDSSGLRTGSGSVGTDARQATASAAAAAPLGRPVHNVGVQAASLGENAPSDGAFAHEGLPARREAQVQTSVGLTVRARARAAQDAPLSLTPLLLASQGGQPAAAAAAAAAGALQDEDVGGFVSISSTPAAMQTLDGASRPPSALPTPVTMVLQPAAQAAAAGGGTPALAGAAMDTPGLLDDTPGLGPMDGQTGPGVSGLWPASLPRSVRGPGKQTSPLTTHIASHTRTHAHTQALLCMRPRPTENACVGIMCGTRVHTMLCVCVCVCAVSYGDDPADELPQGGHITSLIDPPEPYDEDPSDDGYQSEGESEGEGAQRPGVVGAAGRSSGTLDTLRPREGAGRVTEPGKHDTHTHTHTRARAPALSLTHTHTHRRPHRLYLAHCSQLGEHVLANQRLYG